MEVARTGCGAGIRKRTARRASFHSFGRRVV
jgi:hypothetical protein